MRISYRWLGILVVIGVGGMIWWLWGRAPALPAYVTEPVVRGSIVEQVRVTGRVQAASVYALRFEEGGKIMEDYVRVGDSVEAQTLLASLDTGQRLLEVKDAKARLDTLRAQLAQQLAGPTTESIAVVEEHVKRSEAAVRAVELQIVHAMQTRVEAQTKAKHVVTTAEAELVSLEQEKQDLEQQIREDIGDAQVRLANAERALIHAQTDATHTRATAEEEVRATQKQLELLQRNSLVDIRDALQYVDNLLGVSDKETHRLLEASFAGRDPQAENNVRYYFPQVENKVRALGNISYEQTAIQDVLASLERLLGQVRVALDATWTTESLSKEQLDAYKTRITTYTQTLQRIQIDLETQIQAYELALLRASGTQSSTIGTQTQLENEVYAAKQALDRVEASAPLLRSQQLSKITSATQRVTDARLAAQQVNTEWEHTLRELEETKKATLLDVATRQAELRQARALPRTVDIATYETEIRQGEIQVERAEQLLTRMELRAPVAGIITEVHGKPGEYVQPVSAYMTLYGFEKEIVVDVAETEIAQVRTNAEVLLTFDALSYTETFAGTVVDIEPAETIIDGVTYYRVKVHITEEDPRILSGMTANVEIITGKAEDALLIPALAVRYDGNKRYVERLEQGEARRVYVTLGLEGDLFYEVIEGLHEGDAIITFQ